jgi:hypothetical protein
LIWIKGKSPQHRIFGTGFSIVSHRRPRLEIGCPACPMVSATRDILPSGDPHGGVVKTTERES